MNLLTFYCQYTLINYLTPPSDFTTTDSSGIGTVLMSPLTYPAIHYVTYDAAPSISSSWRPSTSSASASVPTLSHFLRKVFLYSRTVFARIVFATTILFFWLWVRQLFNGDNYSKEETINFFRFGWALGGVHNLNCCCTM